MLRGLFVAAVLCACAGARAGHISSAGEAEVRPEGNDDSGRWFLVSCPGRWTSCTQTAGLLCPGGYFVVNADGHPMATALGGLPEVRDGELRVRCAPSVLVGGR